MLNLTIEQKPIAALFSDADTDFLIPDYQRPYAWGETECQTLWDDIKAFAFPDDDRTKFNPKEKYFLGSIVTFINDETGKQEIIDGQQRLTTLMLLLRAFYARFGGMKDSESQKTMESIGKCIWKTDEFGNPIKSELKIMSEVASDDDKDEFLSILQNGAAPKDTMKSRYAENYRFFQERIEEFLQVYPGYFAYLPIRILNNCILLPIKTESQGAALTIFSTLNNRGMPLSDADIFKAQFYKYYSALGKKQQFIAQWRELEEATAKIFHPITGTPMDELFTRYMYYERAKQGNKNSTTEALRKFYEKNGYALLKNETTFQNLIDLCTFWTDVANQNPERFSERVLRRLFVLNYAPNGMWTYIVSVYYMHKRDDNGALDDTEFYEFLNLITAYIWTYAIINPGVNALRTPVYAQMVNIVNNDPIAFTGFDLGHVQTAFQNFTFKNGRPITKSMLAWWAFHDDTQGLLSLETAFEIEHIYAKKRAEKEPLKAERNIESLGNKALLEKRINIRASDYRFSDKIGFYLGTTGKRQKDATKIQELLTLARSRTDFTEADIVERETEIIESFIKYLASNKLAV
ncbi:DUF262 domain-containing protein [uncultured Ruminococcus sp.]|uniref:DUF262 domain-containing protein n=1 Tax=uncultured Ruminococcus sp. TaxID=165186 RepID=UPI0025D680A9|nr:DUF262 domain-containing protein [uncultured Ruminococcus sp.]